MKIWCTTYCNHGHDLDTGKPIDHECYILPPDALWAERMDNIPLAIELIAAAKPLKAHRGVKRDAD